MITLTHSANWSHKHCFEIDIHCQNKWYVVSIHSNDSHRYAKMLLQNLSDLYNVSEHQHSSFSYWTLRLTMYLEINQNHLSQYLFILSFIDFIISVQLFSYTFYTDLLSMNLLYATTSELNSLIFTSLLMC